MNTSKAMSITTIRPLHLSHDDELEGNKMKCLRKRTTDNSFLPPWRKRMGLFVFAVLQNGLAGGVIFGWASIDTTILSASDESGGAGLTLHETTLIFSRASSVAMLSSLILGILLDNYGPRVCSIISSCIIVVGCHIFASSHHFTGASIGACLIGFGGPGITSSIIHIANLFPNNEYLVMSCLSGSIAMSFSVFAVFDFLWTSVDTMSFRSLFHCYEMIIILLALGAFFMYPDEPYDELEDDFFEPRDETEHLIAKSTALPPTTIPYSPSEPANQPLEASLSHDHCLHHRQNHIRSVAPGPSLHIEQPLDSFLRDGHNKILHNTESFVASKQAFESGDVGETVVTISLKDQPFYNQLFSPSYVRSFLVFLVASFVTNFYVVSISTELADLQEYPSDVQHNLARSFTLIMSMGILGSILVGWLIDKLGLPFCTAMTLLFGQLQMVLLVVGGTSEGVLVASFWVYTLFRQFLYPVFIASLTSRLGFKYFGVLLGIGFALAGMAQLLLAALDEAVQGDCHDHVVLSREEETSSSVVDEECEHGHWTMLHVAQFVILGALLIIPVQDHRDKVIRESKIRESSLSPQPVSCSYGTDL